MPRFCIITWFNFYTFRQAQWDCLLCAAVVGWYFGARYSARFPFCINVTINSIYAACVVFIIRITISVFHFLYVCCICIGRMSKPVFIWLDVYSCRCALFKTRSRTQISEIYNCKEWKNIKIKLFLSHTFPVLHKYGNSCSL